MTNDFKLAEKEFFQNCTVISVRRVEKGIFSIQFKDEKGAIKNAALEKMTYEDFLELKTPNESLFEVKGHYLTIHKFI